MLISIVEDSGHDNERLRRIINNAISQIDNNDIIDLGSLYIIGKERKIELFHGIKMNHDPYYINRGKDGKAAIVISANLIFKKKQNIFIAAIFKIIALLFLVIASIPIMIWCLKDRNFKFWYIGKEGVIKRKYYNKEISRSERRLVANLLYFIGVHKIYKIYIKEGQYYDINVFEYAVKYRNSILGNFKWLCEPD